MLEFMPCFQALSPFPRIQRTPRRMLQRSTPCASPSLGTGPIAHARQAGLHCLTADGEAGCGL